MRSAQLRSIAAALLLLAACAEPGSSSRAGNTIVIAATSEPDALFPPAAENLAARQATELIYEYLADVGTGMNTIGEEGFVKEIASGWRWSPDSLSIAFEINPRARWHDGKPVTARDVKFSFSVYADSALSNLASSLTAIDSVTAQSPSTAVFWFNGKTPHQFYDAAAQMLILPEHVFGSIARDSLRERGAAIVPVGSGRFRPGKWNRGSSFELVAESDHYRGRSNADRIVWIIAPEYKAAVTKLLAGEADVFASVRRESIPELTSRGKFKLVLLPGMDYTFVQLNLRRFPFASTEVRRALAMALDRESMVKNLFDSLARVSIGPTVRAYPTTDTSVVAIPYDTTRAAQILDSLGWRRGADGMRKLNGRPLRFTAIVPATSITRRHIAELIQEQLRLAGVDMNIEEMDFNAFSSRQSSGDFDAALASWHLPSSTESLKGAWTTGGANNHGGYSNPKFDAAVDSALEAATVPLSREYFRRANQIIVDDAAALWLYEPRTVLAISKRIETGPMRPSAWWLDIASWKIHAK
jgi:peptide/nickel transport system substrate-binding protein